MTAAAPIEEVAQRRSTAAPLLVAASVDVGAAAAASLMVSPFIYTIDRAIVESAAGGTTLLRAFISNAAQLLRCVRQSMSWPQSIRRQSRPLHAEE